MTGRPRRPRQTREPVACATCGASDARDAAHAQGCPALAPVSKQRLIALALQVQAGWAANSEIAAKAKHASNSRTAYGRYFPDARRENKETTPYEERTARGTF